MSDKLISKWEVVEENMLWQGIFGNMFRVDMFRRVKRNGLYKNKLIKRYIIR